jgi:hypothetical protein
MNLKIKMAKGLLLALLTSCYACCQAQNIEDLTAYENSIKPGTQLIYDVSTKDKQYKLTATLKKTGDEIAFEWKTSDPDNKSGSVTLTANALAKADALKNNFKVGDNRLDNETCLWMSKKVYTDLTKNAQTSIRLNGATDTTTTMGYTVGEFNFNLNGNLMAVPGMELQGGDSIKYTVDVLESPKFPIIYKIDLGWTMVLSEIKSE